MVCPKEAGPGHQYYAVVLTYQVTMLSIWVNTRLYYSGEVAQSSNALMTGLENVWLGRLGDESRDHVGQTWV